MLDAIGWVATAIFSASYFFRQPAALRRIQAGAALLWVVYGLAIGALPVVVANVIVAAAAVYSSIPNRNKIDYTSRSLSNSKEKS
jgi:predicted cation transporter